MRRTIQTTRSAIFIFVWFFILCVLFLPPCYAAQYKVTLVTDGDTIVVVSNGSKHRIRLVGIAAPEKSRGKNQPGQPFSQTSTKHLANLVLDKYVDILSYGTDRYDRMLSVVYVDGLDVNLEMVKPGLAEVYRGRPAESI